MSERSLVSSRTALGVFCGGMLLLFAGCAFIYDFDGYDDGLSAVPSGSGGAGSNSTIASASSGAQGGSGSGGGGGGACDPEAAPNCGVNTLATGEAIENFGDIALGDTLVFWVQDGTTVKGTVQMRSKDDSAPTPMKLPIADVITISHIAAVDDSALYAASNNYILKVTLPGQTLDPIDPGDSATGIAVYKDMLYWPSKIQQKLRKGQPGDVVTLSDVTGPEPALIAAGKADPDQVVWTYQGLSSNNGGVRRLNTSKDLAMAQNQPSGITTDGTFVYWVTANGVIHSLPIDGGSNLTDGKMSLPGVNMLSGRIVESGSRVYWLGADTETCQQPNCTCDTDCGAIWTAPKADIANATVFARDNWTKLRGLAADKSSVYWTAGTGKAWLLLQKEVFP